MNKLNFKKLVIAFLLPQLAGLIGALFTTPAIPVWYAGINKPVFSPPNWLFAPVWTTLFILMGIASYLVWNKDGNRTEVHSALKIYLIQLGLNTLWSILFFGLSNPLLALGEILVLWLFICLTIKHFSKISLWAGRLLYPYLLWVSFAAFLNGAIVWLNR